MEEFWILILVLFFATNLLDKAESVQLEETTLNPLDEIFGEGWWGNDKAEEWHKLTLEQTFHHQIDKQNTQIGQIETNSTDQNPPLTESDHSENAKNGKEQREIRKEITSNENIAEDERKRKIIDKFHALKDEFKQKGKYSKKERTKIENKIAKHLKVSREKIYKWKNEFGLSRKRCNFGKQTNDHKHLIAKFDQMKAELTRAGFKNSYHNQINETVAKELGLSFTTIYNWKRKLSQTKPKHKYSHSEQKELMIHYYEIKDKNLEISDKDIAKILKIGSTTLVRWKSQFKRQKFHQNFVDGHSVEANSVANVQEIGNSNSEI